MRKRIKSIGIDLSNKHELLALCTTKLNKSEQDIISMFKSGNVSDNDIDVLLTKKQMRQRLSLKDPAATVIIPWRKTPSFNLMTLVFRYR